MKVIETGIQDLVIIEPRIFEDGRGYFFESYNQKTFADHGITHQFVQDNQSKSAKGVLRGLHFQRPPHAQGKLVSVLSGAVLDVAVDIRSGSPTYGQHVMVELTADNKRFFFVPPGFAHGFITMEDDTIFTYKCTDLYHPESEDCISWNDPDLNIDWGHDQPLVSGKDQQGQRFADFASPF